MQDFDAHVEFSFIQVPRAPAWANRSARVRRWFAIAFAESWLAVLLFRVKQRLHTAHVPFLPYLCDTISRALFRVSIGNAVDAGPGLMVTHGNVVIDGRTRIGRNCQVNPWVTIGLSNSRKLGFSAEGPTIGDFVHIGTGAKIIGPVTIGDYARIGANAVVVRDVPAYSTAVGIPARILPAPGTASTEGASSDDELRAHMRRAIVDYKLRRRSLRSAVLLLDESFGRGSPALRSARDDCAAGLKLLDAVTTGAEASPAQVAAALDAVDAALEAAPKAATPEGF